MKPRPTIRDVHQALKPLANIPRPYGDNEGDPINSPTVFPKLSPKHQELVSSAEEVLYEYTRTSDGQGNRRAVTTLKKNGYPTYLGPYQYDAERVVGDVQIGDWTLDLSDPSNESEPD